MANNETYQYDSFNRELILDLTLGAFTIYTITSDETNFDFPLVREYVKLPSFYKQAVAVQIYSGNDLIVDGLGDPVTFNQYIVKSRTTDERRENFKFVTTGGTVFSLSEYRDYRFYDWYSVDNVGYSFDSYLLTGYNLANSFNMKQSVYLQVFCERTEDYYHVVGATVDFYHKSSCKIQAQWNWADSAYQGKWGETFEAYRLLKNIATSPSDGDVFDYGDTVITTKNKLRGRGRALSLYIHSDPGKDLKLLGWNLLTTVNNEP